jgi:hypothetical protein
MLLYSSVFPSKSVLERLPTQEHQPPSLGASLLG